MAKKTQINLRDELRNKRIPILTLDKRWHDLFPDFEKSSQIKTLEEQVNYLVKRQGHLTNEMKDLKNLKARLMSEIMNNMEATLENGSSIKKKKLDQSQRLIKEINEKLKNNEAELDDIPSKIKESNEELMIASMTICYEKLSRNSEQIKELGEWIEKVRFELKDRILIKQEMEIKNDEIYSYIHNLLGPDVVQILDEKFNIND